MSQKHQNPVPTSGQKVFSAPKIHCATVFCGNYNTTRYTGILSLPTTFSHNKPSFTVCCSIMLHSVLLSYRLTIPISFPLQCNIMCKYIDTNRVNVVRTLFGWFTSDLDVSQTYHSELKKLPVANPTVLCGYSNVYC